MARIDRGKIGSQGEVLPKLEASMIGGKKTVLTIDHARQVQGKFGAFLAISYKEFPDHEMITNATQEDALLALVDAGRMTDDLDRWNGVRVAFEKRTNTNPETQRPVEKLYAIDPDDQDAAISEFDKAMAENAGVGAKGKRAGAKAR
jgi:hypothetical protein